MPKLIYILVCLLFAQISFAQKNEIKGRVLDKGKINPVAFVDVFCTCGTKAKTDTLGYYKIMASPQDSLFFVYNGKPTEKFSVNKIKDPTQFDLALHIEIPTKYKSIEEVVVRAKSYKEDSIENREAFKSVFGFSNKVGTSTLPEGGVGLDLNAIINSMRFERNKRMKKFRLRLEAEEQEKYIDYRFNKRLVKRITNLDSTSIEKFMVIYRPTYSDLSDWGELELNQYIISAWYQFVGRKQDD